MLSPAPYIKDDFQLSEWLRLLREFLTLTTTATLDFGNTAANTNTDLTVTVTGAKSGDTVIATPPLTIETGLTWCAFVSAANTVTVRIHAHGSGAVNPASAIWRITVLRY